MLLAVEHALGKLCYFKKGSGKRVIIFFHGFGQDHNIFLPWMTDEEKCTYYALDLPFHGSSGFKDTFMDPLDWQIIFKAFIAKEKLNEFELVGFSLGGRFVFSCMVTFNEMIRQVVLLAPDGVYRSLWYRIAISPLIRPVFRYVMEHDTALDHLTRFVERFGLAPRSLVKFARRELADTSSRSKVFRTWVYLKKLKHSDQTLSLSVQSIKGPTYLILGAWDSVIPAGKLIPRVGANFDHKWILDLRHEELVSHSKLRKHIQQDHHSIF